MKGFSFPLPLLLCVLLPFFSARAGSNGYAKDNGRYAIPTWEQLQGRSLSLAEAIDIAAAQNAVILAARKDVEARFGIAVQVRAIDLPKVLAEADYLVQEDSRIEANQIENRQIPEFRLFFPGLGIDTTLGGGLAPKINNQSWTADVRIVQSLYEGGRMLSALRQERLIREQAMLDFQTTLADVLLGVRVAYDDAQLAALQITLREQAVGILGGIVGKMEDQRQVGVVTEFEEIRARVEQDNARTPLAFARQNLVIAKQQLVQLMGYDVPPEAANNINVRLSTPLRAPRYEAGLASALVTAERQRSELAAIRVSGKLADEAVVVARAGYKPSVQAFAGYGAVSRVNSRDPSDPYDGGLAGVQMRWALFDGLLTQGRIAEAKARRDQIGHNTQELERQIRLDVRSQWARMVEARNILAVQGRNVESAGRALELSDVRFGTGIGSQVEVLSAQTAVTDARDFYAIALRDYSVAYSRLLRATGEDMQQARPRR